ncbi:uncharacterized protein LOC117101950 [Anneissia japonica]|uniref:uncharacterized protein LOC117101950 n=1 Tax=Anneissia japonica TaxID=1529436 RepID=UPI001425A13E|nr:uncharacterized protein LOC117101950 [Anneissia japonica]XP_033097967.1 uncharacterized protein LOC117101950 [Anneissia japonica]XP_033097968.1 uncharacterized protein LOC117101950 [Anneissia japonica]
MSEATANSLDEAPRRAKKLGLGTPRPMFQEGVDIVQISSGSNHAICLSSEGKVYTFGSRRLGALGRREPKGREGMTAEVELPEKVVQVAAGQHHCIALTEKGQVFCWGSMEPEKAEPVTTLLNAVSGITQTMAHEFDEQLRNKEAMKRGFRRPSLLDIDPATPPKAKRWQTDPAANTSHSNGIESGVQIETELEWKDDAEEEYPLSPYQVEQAVKQSNTPTAFARKLARILFTTEDLMQATCSGRTQGGRRNQKLDPKVLEIIKQQTLENYDFPGENEDKIWRKCLKGIDNIGRHLKYYDSGNRRRLRKAQLAAQKKAAEEDGGAQDDAGEEVAEEDVAEEPEDDENYEETSEQGKK